MLKETWLSQFVRNYDAWAEWASFFHVSLWRTAQWKATLFAMKNGFLLLFERRWRSKSNHIYAYILLTAEQWAAFHSSPPNNAPEQLSEKKTRALQFPFILRAEKHHETIKKS